VRRSEPMTRDCMSDISHSPVSSHVFVYILFCFYCAMLDISAAVDYALRHISSKWLDISSKFLNTKRYVSISMHDVYEKISFLPVSLLISEMIQDRAIVTVEC